MRSGDQGIYSGVRCRSCPTFAWAATELPCHDAPSWKCPGTRCWRLREPANYTSRTKSQEKTAPFITKFPNTYSDLVWPLTFLLGEVREKNTPQMPWGKGLYRLSSQAPLPNPRCHRNWFMELPLTPLLRREAGQFSCRSGVHCMLKGSSRPQAGNSTLGYKAQARPGAGSPYSGDTGPHWQGASSPGSVSEADRQHQQSTSKPLRHASRSVCCRIPVSFQLLLSTFKLALCRCVHVSVTAIPPECPLLFPDL